MDKLSVKASILSAISEEIDLWLDKSETIKDGYEYETEFMDVSRKVNKIMLAESLGQVSTNKNKKKTSDLFWETRSK
jgi:hypothetical protein